MQKLLLLSTLFIYYAFAGETLTPVLTTPITVAQYNNIYIAGGVGTFSLDDAVTSETLSANTALLIAGYRFNAYLSLEARYYRSMGGEIEYDGGGRASPDTTYDSTFTDLSAFLKLGYPSGDFTPYLLLGYGKLKLTDIAGGDREESAVQYGVGASYRVTEQVSLFVDWVRAYDDRGFDGRAKQDDLSVDLFSVGVIYRF